ncbi:hypothetical protein HMPREF0454_02491 [Hafnia alvei ATCC 51873]|uniref:Uncharacterized protein n=1 Tax=Hafnia alvei ATCC 51873 TaxID=1002364 RepID=G9Y7B8_HAFAL|nr:hypothetical protein HMPREF0454_02491 [Hafnia alvei ATCC 51873]
MIILYSAASGGYLNGKPTANIPFSDTFDMICKDFFILAGEAYCCGLL